MYRTPTEFERVGKANDTEVADVRENQVEEVYVGYLRINMTSTNHLAQAPT